MGKTRKKQEQKDVDNSGKSGIIEVGKNDSGSDNILNCKISNVYTGIRNELPLTKQEKEQIIAYSRRLALILIMLSFLMFKGPFIMRSTVHLWSELMLSQMKIHLKELKMLIRE